LFKFRRSFSLTLAKASLVNRDKNLDVTFNISGNNPIPVEAGSTEAQVSGTFESIQVGDETYNVQLTENVTNDPGLNVVFEPGTHVPASPYQLAITTFGYIPLVLANGPYPGAFAHWKWDNSIEDVSTERQTTVNALSGDPVRFGVDNVNGKPLPYVTFSGTNYLNVTLSSAISKPFTIAVWAHPNNQYFPVFEFNEDHGHIVISGRLEFSDNNGASNFQNITLTQWIHVAYVYDGSNCRVYINGAESAPNTPTTAIDLASTTLKIGYDDDYKPNVPAKSGTKLGEIIVLKTAATAAQITQIYNRSY